MTGMMLSSIRDQSLQRKLTLIIMGTAGMVILFSSTAFIAYDRISSREALIQRLTAIAEIVGANSSAALMFDNRDDAEEVLSSLRSEAQIGSAAILKTDGLPLATYGRVESANLLSQPPPVGYRFGDDFMEMTEPIVLEGSQIGTVYLRSDLQELDARLFRYLRIVGVFAIGAGLLAFLLATRLRRIVTRPILGLLETTNRVSGEGQYGLRATKYGDDELGRLVDSFNGMLARIEEGDAALRSSLSEKDVLLKEVHHRVKNNLQVVSSLINLQSSHVQTPELTPILAESHNRIRAIALVHERLYQSENMAHPNVADYLGDLCDNLRTSFARADRHIELHTEIDSIDFDIDGAIACGLIVNELVTNALKHAFGPAGGTIRVSMKSLAGECELRVADDGTGVVSGIDVKNPTSLGLQLVNSLSRQLHGSLDLDSTEGTAFVVRFPQPSGERS